MLLWLNAAHQRPQLPIACAVTLTAPAPVVEYAGHQSPTRRLFLRSCTSPRSYMTYLARVFFFETAHATVCYPVVATVPIFSVCGNTFVLRCRLIALCAALPFFSSAADQFNLIAKKRWNQEGFDAKRHEDQTHDQRNVTHDDLFVDPELIIREEDWANHKVDEGKL